MRLWLDVGVETRETKESDKEINERQSGQKWTDIDTQRPCHGKEEGIEDSHGWKEMEKKRHSGGRRKRQGNQKVLNVPFHDRASS